MSEAELKPCPFCGVEDEAEMANADPEGKYVYCPTCGASGGIGDDEKDAAYNWNTRPIEDALLKRAEAAEARAERLENELSEVVAYGGYYADIENRLPPEGQVVKVIASSTHGVDDFTVLRMDEKWYFASDPPREVHGEFEVIRIKPWDVKRFGASYDEEF